MTLEQFENLVAVGYHVRLAKEQAAEVVAAIRALRAESARLSAEVEAARTAYRERYDCEDDASPADLIRRCLEAEKYEYDRFKARGAEMDRLSAEVERRRESSQQMADMLAAAEERLAALRRGIEWIASGGQPLTPDTLRRLLEGDARHDLARRDQGSDG